MKLKTAFLQMLYPEGIKCNICGRELFEETRFSLCPECIPKYKGKPCNKCGRSMSNDADFCLDCQNYSTQFDRAYAPYIYEDNAQKLVYKLKYGNEKYLAKYMAEMMYDCFENQRNLPDMITFVPMHKKRQKERGYNQAEELAREFSKIINVECVELLKRNIHTQNLARMSAPERREAVKGVFSIVESNKTLVKDKNILLIDDVLTTGATSGACSEILKKNGAKRVEILTFATSKIKIKLY